MEILLAITFVFGVLYLLTMTKLFNKHLSFILNALIPHKDNTVFSGFCRVVGTWFFYFSLCFQTWYWLFGGKPHL